MNTIPVEMLIQNGYQKYFLRMAMKDILNDEVRLNRDKKGFNASFNSLFDIKDNDFLDIIYSKNEINEIIDLKKIDNILSEDYISNQDKKMLFNILNLKIFMR